MVHFTGARYSNNHVAGVTHAPLRGVGNSGVGALALADSWGVARIIMLGYDGQHTGGKTHWHGDHPKPLGNAGSVSLWHQKFQTFSSACRAHVINATRETALTCFQRMDLETALEIA